MTFGTTFSLLTLGCLDSYATSSASAKVSRTNVGAGKWVVSSKVTPVNDLFVDTKTKSYHTITFNGTYNRLDVDTRAGGLCDANDNVTFNGDVSKSKVITGNSSSTAGDVITFNQSVTNTTITASSKNDNIVFAKSNTSGTTVNAANGADSVRFLDPAQVGANTTINLGGTTPSTGDGATDIIFVASTSTLAGSNIRINNFVDGVDQIRVGATTITTKADALTQFGAGSITFG